MTEDRIYTGSEVCRLLGLSMNELRYWDQIGLAPATAKSATGRQRRYTMRDLTRVRVAQALRAPGVNLRGQQLKLAVVRVVGNLP